MPELLGDQKIVLVTGINGYIASRIGLSLLEKGYVLRGTLRSPYSADALLKGAYEQYADRVQIVVVPDMTIPKAFDEAVKGAILYLSAMSLRRQILIYLKESPQSYIRHLPLIMSSHATTTLLRLLSTASSISSNLRSGFRVQS